MLQQTQVSRVLEFYPRFLARFPTVHHLARATPGRVREAWEGLGYYARARNLHALARHVTRDGADGVLPAHPDELRGLPGIGAYTAGAVASFAYETARCGRGHQCGPGAHPRVRAEARPQTPPGPHHALGDRRACSSPNGQGDLDTQPGPHGTRGPRLHRAGGPVRGVSGAELLQDRPEGPEGSGLLRSPDPDHRRRAGEVRFGGIPATRSPGRHRGANRLILRTPPDAAAVPPFSSSAPWGPDPTPPDHWRRNPTTDSRST